MSRPAAPPKSIHVRLLSGAAWAIAGKFLSVLTALLTGVLLTRLLPVDAVGIYFLIMSLLGIFVLVGQLGLQSTVVKMIGEAVALGNFDRTRLVVRSAFRYCIAGSVFSALSFILLDRIFLPTRFYEQGLEALSWQVSLLVVFVAIGGLSAECFRGLHDIRSATFFGGPFASLIFALVLVINLLSEIGVTLGEVLFFLLFSSAFNALLSIFFLRRKLVDGKVNRSKVSEVRTSEIASMAFPVWVTGAALFLLSQADIVVLSMFRSASEVAVYGAAVKLLTFISTPLLVLNSVIPSIIAELYAQNLKKELQQILRTAATVATLPVIVILVIFTFHAESILAILYGDFYRTGSSVVIILSLGQLVNVVTGSCGLTLMMTGHQHTMMMITLVCGAITLGLAVMLGEKYGATGVATAASIGMSFQNLAMLISVRRKTGMWTHMGTVRIGQLRTLVRIFFSMKSKARVR